MKNPIVRIRESLSARLSGWAVLFAALLFVTALGYLFFQSRRAVRAEAFGGAMEELENTVMRVNGILQDAEVVADNTEWLIRRKMNDPDAIPEIACKVVENNEFLNGCSISFEPYFYPGKGLYYSIFSYREGETVRFEQEGDENYQYFYYDWYLLPKLIGKPCWTEPYGDFDENFDGQVFTSMMVSYCRPIFDEDSSFAGSFSLDISLEWLSETITAFKPYPNAYCMMLGRGGTYLVHPDPEKLFYQTIFTEGMLGSDPQQDALGKAMLAQKSGMMEVTFGKERCIVLYKPLETTGWSVAIVCPEKDVFSGFYRLQKIVLGIVLVGLALLFFLLTGLIRRQLRPLRTLSEQVGILAGGNLNHPLPLLDRCDEIGVLNRSFRDMQSSLSRYIEELTRTTASKERIEQEIRMAHDIQMAMVPYTFPERPDVDLYAAMTPAREVGGDLYDFIIQNEKLCFCIGDVSGKGVPASLMMAVSRARFRLLARQNLSPSEIARQINDLTAEDNDQMIFVTMFFGRIDLKTGEMEYCNCGHNAPVLMPLEADGTPRFLDCKPNLAVGIMAGFDYEGQTLPDLRNQVLFLYTDGLNEAENRRHEEFGNERMLAVLGAEPFQNAHITVDRLLAAVDRHVDGAEASDDLTMMCIKVG